MKQQDIPSQISKEFAVKTQSRNMVAEDRIAWSTKKIESLAVMIDEGYKPKSVPFHEGNPIYRKGNIVFDYSHEELYEIEKCANDINYFANQYSTVMTDNGLQMIKVRDYQERILDNMVENRFNIVLASR